MSDRARMAKQIVEFGDRRLREKSALLTQDQINSARIKVLIEDMRELLLGKKLGVGLAAPQVGENIALAIIAIRPSKTRPKVEPFDVVIINPTITEFYGRRTQLWEGCISGGPGKAGLFAKVPRHKKIKLKYYDEKGELHHKVFDGLAAHVIQHEVDHLNSVLFVDRVKDTTSYVTYKEYLKLVKANASKVL